MRQGRSSMRSPTRSQAQRRLARGHPRGPMSSPSSPDPASRRRRRLSRSTRSGRRHRRRHVRRRDRGRAADARRASSTSSAPSVPMAPRCPVRRHHAIGHAGEAIRHCARQVPRGRRSLARGRHVLRSSCASESKARSFRAEPASTLALLAPWPMGSARPRNLSRAAFTSSPIGIR